MKKLLMMLLITLLIPAGVNAMAVSESFYVGDSVSVGIINDEEPGIAFHVIADSGPNDQTVTLIYDGILDGSSTVYDESNPADNHDATVNFNESIAYQVLNKAINKEGAKWRVETASILSKDDLTKLGITKNSAGIYEITDKYSFLAPIKLNGVSSDIYNYWTSISEGNDSVYCVTLDENNTSLKGTLATLELKDITSITNSPKCGIRPVVVVDKKYILCNNTRPSTSTTTTEKPTTPNENVKTGVEDYLLPLVSIILIAGITIAVTKKKEVFQDI